MRSLFSEALKVALRHRYHKLPTSTFLAKEFNIRSGSSKEVSPEIARRWLQGSTIPDLEKLNVLKDWLGIDLNGFGGNHNQKTMPQNSRIELAEMPVDLEKINQFYIQDIENLRENFLEKIEQLKNKYKK